jgi:hypothetical protein
MSCGNCLSVARRWHTHVDMELLVCDLEPPGRATWSNDTAHYA